MMKPYISATTLKNNVSEVLNDVYFKGDERIVVRYGKPVAKIVPVKEGDLNKKKLKEVLDSSFGALPDFPDVTKYKRTGRKKLLTLAGVWNNEDGKIIEENALNFRKKGKFTTKKHELSS